MALAEKLHHTSMGQRFARAGEEGLGEHDAPRRQKPPPPQAFFRLFDEEDAKLGTWPGSVADPVPHGRVETRTVEHRIEACPFVQLLDAPVPQMGDQAVELLQRIVVGRSLRSSWSKCQLYLVMCLQSLPPSSVRGVRFVVVSQDSVQQRLVQSSSLILQFLRVGRGVAEVFPGPRKRGLGSRMRHDDRSSSPGVFPVVR